MCFSLTILFGRSRKRLKKKRGKGWSRYSNTSCMSKSVQVSLKCEKNLWLGYKFAGLLHLGTTLWIDYYKLGSECFDNTITPVSFSLPYCHENQISFIFLYVYPNHASLCPYFILHGQERHMVVDSGNIATAEE